MTSAELAVILRLLHVGLFEFLAGLRQLSLRPAEQVVDVGDIAERHGVLFGYAGPVDRPGDLGGSDSWEDAEPCQHSGSTPRSCASARSRWCWRSGGRRG